MELWMFIGNSAHLRALLPQLYHLMADFSVSARVCQDWGGESRQTPVIYCLSAWDQPVFMLRAVTWQKPEMQAWIPTWYLCEGECHIQRGTKCTGDDSSDWKSTVLQLMLRAIQPHPEGSCTSLFPRSLVMLDLGVTSVGFHGHGSL